MDPPPLTPPLAASPDRRAWLDRVAGLARWALAIYWPALALGTHWPRLNLNAAGPSGALELDKALHFGAFGGLAVLLHASLPRSLRPPRGLVEPPSTRRDASALPRSWLAGMIASAYAVLDEVTQPWTGRELHLDDVVASLMGVAAAVLLVSPRPDPGRARRAVAWLARAIGLFSLPVLLYFALAPGAKSPLLELYAYLGVRPLEGDQLLHGRLAGGVTLTLAAAAWLGLRHRGAAAVVTAAAMLGSGRFIEWAQLRTGRSDYVDPRDIAAHELAVVWVVAAWVAVVATRPAWPAAWRATVGLFGFARAGTGEGDHAAGRFVGHAAVVSALTLVSRLSGLVRDAVLARFLGLSVAADAFFLGFLVPNLFRRLFGEGALSAAFIPRYAKLREADPELARRFAAATIAALGAVLAGLTLLAEAALWAAASAGGWSERAALAIELTRWMLPYMPMVCVVAVLGGVLQVHRRFAPAAAAPVVLNLGIIGFCAWAARGTPEGADGAMIARGTAGGVLVAGLVQLGWLWLAATRAARPAWRFAGAGEPLKKMLRVMGPMVAGLAVYQLNALLDTLIAFGLSAPRPAEGRAASATFSLLGRSIAYPMQSGDVAALQWAQRLYQFPLGVFGIAIATAIFPALAAAAGRADRGPGEGGSFSAILRQGLKLAAFVAMPAAVGLVLVGGPLVSAVFERGAFGSGDAARVATILVGYAVGVWAYTTSQVLTRGHYAREDGVTPMKIAFAMVALNLALNLVLIWPLGAAGLAWSTAASGTAHAALLGVVLHRRSGGVVDRGVASSWARTAAATLLMLAAAWPLANWAEPRFDAWVTLAIVVPAAVAVYAAAAALLNRDELRALTKRP